MQESRLEISKRWDLAKPSQGVSQQLGSWAPTPRCSASIFHIRIDRCVTVVSGPERCRVITEDPQECIEAWEEAFGIYRAKRRRIRLLMVAD